MECLLAFVGQDFTVIAADATSRRSILQYSQDLDRFVKMTSTCGTVGAGDEGDRVQFLEYIAKNVQLHKMRNGYELSTHAVANYTRRNIAEFLRSRGAYQVNMVIAGCDKESGPAVYFLDYLGSRKL